MTNQHASDCAVHNGPAYPAGPCDCHLFIESRLDEMINHAYQGSTEAAFDIGKELVERYKAMQPFKMQPCAGRNCGSTDPNLHSAECFEDYEKATGINQQESVACQHKRYSVDVKEQTGTCYDCGAEGRMQFVVNDTRPQPAAWVGLTDEEIEEVCWTEVDRRLASFARAIEAKLKEKNT